MALSLLFCLFVYVFYRTEHTLVNRVIIAMFTAERYHTLKTVVTAAVPLNDFCIYCLPEGLWVLCITITSRFFYLKLRGRHYTLTPIPLLLAIVMEVFQLLHISNGRFDVMDIVSATIFWLLALWLTRRTSEKEALFSFSRKSVLCVFSYSIVYLAHVFVK